MNATISIARAGQELGAWSAADIQKMLQSGVLIPSDNFWQEGMTEWSSLSCFSPAAPETANLAKIVFPGSNDSTGSRPNDFQKATEANDSSPSHRAMDTYRAEPIPRRSFWIEKPSRFVAVLGFLFLSLGLCISLFAPVGGNLIGSSKNRNAYVQMQPSRAAYEQLLAQTHAYIEPDGTILIADSNGATLSLAIDYRKSHGLPEVPFHYTFKSYYDKITIAPKDDPHNNPYSEADAGMEFVPAAALEITAAPDEMLSKAIDNLVTWSVADAQAGAIPRYDVAASGGSSAYFVRCEQENGYFYLLQRKHVSLASLQSMRYVTVEGYVMPVTDFSRAHLWRYLIDHFGEIKQLAESYLTAKRSESSSRDTP